MRVVFTGAAGFIGSHPSDRLLAAGDDLVGIDCFSEYYKRSLKVQKLEKSRSHDSSHFEDAAF